MLKYFWSRFFHGGISHDIPSALYREHDDKPSKIDINRLDDWATRTCTISPLRVSTQWRVNRPMLKMMGPGLMNSSIQMLGWDIWFSNIWNIGMYPIKSIEKVLTLKNWSSRPINIGWNRWCGSHGFHYHLQNILNLNIGWRDNYRSNM